MAEDLGEEDIVGVVLGFEHVATDGAVGGAEVAWFPGLVEGAEGGGNVLVHPTHFDRFLMIIIPPEYSCPRAGDHDVVAQRRYSFIKCRESSEFIIHVFIEHHGARDVALNGSARNLHFCASSAMRL